MNYETSGLLDNSARRKICNIIINRELQGNPDAKISSQQFYQLAFEITKIFKKESAPVYFTPYVCFSPAQKTAAKGKLLDTFRQRRREFAKSGLITSRKRSRSTSSSCCSESGSSRFRFLRVEEATNKLPAEPSTEADVDDYLLWLKNACDPWITVQSYWEQTRKARFQKFIGSGMSIADYFNEFRALGQTSGLHLLLDDFNHLHVNHNNSLFENWPLYRDRIIAYARKRNDPALKEILTCIDDDDVNEDALNTVAFMSLPFLMSTSTIRKPKIKKQWRPSKLECLQGFITHIKTSAELDASITLRVEKMANLGYNVQPYIIIIGDSVKDIHTRFIVINNVKHASSKDVRYNSTSIVHAVDACFKVLFALNAEYPAESSNVWYFIQRGVYKLSTKYDRVYTTVNSLLNDLDITV
ncbi:hypothetical protein FQR65_LT19117 [Abscondita terminalis]|nr:hypothetical protein FQR65_LT19117 [Abscondita terminalis]